MTNGGKQAIANAFAVLCDPGDEVLVLAPYWTTYPEVIALAGGVPVVDPHRRRQRLPGHRRPARGGPDAPDQGAAVRVALQPDRGGLPARRRSRPSAEWAVEHGLWVLTDEIYEHLVYGDAEHHSMPVLVPELADRCIVVNGVAKTYAMTGWRVGWMIGPTDVVDRGHQPPVARDLQRGQRLPAGGAGRGVRRPRRRWRRCARPSTAGGGPSTRCSTRSTG